MGGTDEQVVVSTWLYKGKCRKKFSAKSCDVPFEFYEFEECVTFDMSDATTSGHRNAVFIPSASQIEDTMLTLEELLDHLEFWNKHAKGSRCH